ncbi:chymotrypsin-2-like isoform X2 [Temnothorax nylanderi]|uniref:chymotrypsin-2-like isoform X2 n=1 Tax=Temnothorax nylanderi TaxID=102681 RepID=UPI003A849EAB
MVCHARKSSAAPMLRTACILIKYHYRIVTLEHISAVGPSLAKDILLPRRTVWMGCLADTQVVGGTNAPDGAYPYQVSLKESSNGRHFCGGAIVSKKYIITAAHCLEGRRYPSDIQIGVGSNHLQSQIIYTANALIIHDNYDKVQNHNDIGLIKLSKDITFNKTITSIALISNNTDFENVRLQVSGWGRLWKSGPNPVNLQHVTVTGFSQKRCAAIYANNITDGHICTLESMGKGVCNGDYGGALTYEDKLVGIVCFGTPCAEGSPDLFTRVYYYRDWINKYINAGCNQQLNILLGLFTMYLCIHSFL